MYSYSGDDLSLESAAFGNGRIIVEEVGEQMISTPQYYIKDHLGSVRVMWDGDNVVGRNDYYTFGERWNDPNSMASISRYKYNGKEDQSSLGLPYTDYGARMYDSKLGRWHSRDPKAMSQISVSPYVYCNNNPVRFIDPDGMKWLTPDDAFYAQQMENLADEQLYELERIEESWEKRIENLKKKEDDGKDKTKSLNKAGAELEKIKEMKNILSDFKRGLNQLRDSEQAYTFKTIYQDNLGTLAFGEDGVIEIRHLATMANRSHETQHAIQYELGKITKHSYRAREFSVINATLEVEAYKVQYSLTNILPPNAQEDLKPQSVFDINTEWLRNVNINGKYPYLNY